MNVEQDLPEGSSERETYHVLRLIRQRYAEGYYADHGIWFDPPHWHGARPDDYPDIPVIRPIPSIMLLPTEGRDYVELESPEGYDDGLPLEIVEQL